MKNGGFGVKLYGLGEIGKDETSENERKRAKIFENVQKMSRNVQKSECVLSKNWEKFRHQATKTLRHKENLDTENK